MRDREMLAKLSFPNGQSVPAGPESYDLYVYEWDETDEQKEYKRRKMAEMRDEKRRLQKSAK